MPSIIRRIGSSFGNIYSRFKQNQPKNFVSNVVPFGSPAVRATSAISKAPSIIKSIYNTAKDFTTRKTINPLAGTTGLTNIIKKGGAILGTGAAVGTLFQASRLTTKAAISGQAPSASDVSQTLSRGAIVGAGIAGSPLGGIIGAVEGTGKSIGSTASNFWDKIRGRGQSRIEDATNIFKDIKDNLPTDPRPQNININYPDWGQIGGTIPQTPTTIYFEQPNLPSVGAGFNPSFSVGGGGLGDTLPLWLLAAGLGGGFLLGRKKKKKKYKKRKRR